MDLNERNGIAGEAGTPDLLNLNRSDFDTSEGGVSGGGAREECPKPETAERTGTGREPHPIPDGGAKPETEPDGGQTEIFKSETSELPAREPVAIPDDKTGPNGGRTEISRSGTAESAELPDVGREPDPIPDGGAEASELPKPDAADRTNIETAPRGAEPEAEPNGGQAEIPSGEIFLKDAERPDGTGTRPAAEPVSEKDPSPAAGNASEADNAPEPGETVLEAVGLTKIYKKGFGVKKSEVVALKNAGFTVRAGEVVGFLGPNGAGKSTAIKLVTGLASMTAGSVKILGYDVKTERKAALAAVGGVIEQPDLYGDMTALELMRYFASLYPDVAFRDAEGGAPKERRENRIASLLKLVGLESRKQDKVKTYSLGMKQRLGIAQALVNKPRLLLLDEPANGLDPAGIKDVRDIVKRLAHELGMAVLVSSHQLQEMQQMCDRVVILYRGEKVAEGELKELLENVSKRRIRVGTPEPARAAEAFRDAEGVTAVSEAGGILLTGEITAGDAAKILVLAGVPFTGIAEDAATLEEFFFRMTKESER